MIDYESKNKSCSIVLLTKNAGKHFYYLLKKLNDQTVQSFETIVIDSGSNDKTIQIAKKFDCNIFKIKSTEFHHSKTRNLGVKISREKNVVFLTQDCIPVNNDFLYVLLEPLKIKNIAAVYGKQIAYPNSSPMEKFFYDYYYPSEKRLIYSNDISNLSKFYIQNVFISDVCSAIKKNAWKKTIFNENIIMSEDKKWATDILKSGKNIIYEPKASVYHSHNYSLYSVFKRRYFDGMAMKQICKSINGISYNGIKYYEKQFKYIYSNYNKWLVFALLYNISSVLGLYLGNHYKYVVLYKYFK